MAKPRAAVNAARLGQFAAVVAVRHVQLNKLPAAPPAARLDKAASMVSVPISSAHLPNSAAATAARQGRTAFPGNASAQTQLSLVEAAVAQAATRA